jgi:hypothetical protein
MLIFTRSDKRDRTTKAPENYILYRFYDQRDLISNYIIPES